MISFTCNICGQPNALAAFDHEGASCSACESNVRLRALVYLLSVELFGEAFPLPEFPCLPAIRGLGLSDQENYSTRLAKKFDYLNTFYDREPYLDITRPHPERYGTYDFILSSDVFEHIAAPVERAFDEAHKLLKPRGLLCMSVPFSLVDSTIERFSGLHEFAVVPLGNTPVLINRTSDGALEIRDDLVFHGGKGATLEMRLFSQKELENKLETAGFKNLRFLTESIPKFGIRFDGGCSLPLVARKQDFFFDRDALRQLANEYAVLRSQLRAVAQSRWIKLGNRFGLGPRLKPPS